MPGQDRNRRGRGLNQFSRKSNTLGPNDPRYRRDAQSGGTQNYVHEPLYIEDGVLKLDIDSSTQQVVGGKVVVKPGTVVPAAHAPTHATGGSDPLSIDDITPTTTKGDLLVENGSNVVRLPVGADGTILAADSADAEGVSWQLGAAAVSPLTTKGDIWAYSTMDDRFPIGGCNGDVLKVDSTQAFGMKWGSALPIKDANCVTILDGTATASAVNYYHLRNAATGGGPALEAIGTDSNVPAKIASKGTSSVELLSSAGASLAKFTPVASSVNFVETTPNTTTNPPALAAAGSDTNVSLRVKSKGTGSVEVSDASNNVIGRFTPVTSGVNYVQTTNAATLSDPVIEAAGSDANIDLRLNGKGTGLVILDKGQVTNDLRLGGSILDTSGNTQLDLVTGGSANYARIVATASGDPPIYGVAGSDSNIDLLLEPKGTGLVLVGVDDPLNEAATVGTAQTFTSKTLTTPKIATILDLNGNEWVQVSATASAVNQVEIVNSATGNPVEIQPAGGDANIGIRIDPKGTGAVTISTLTTGALVEETSKTGITADGIRIKDGSVWHRRQLWQYTDPNSNAAPIAIGTPVATLAGTTVANSNTERPWLIHIVNPGVSGGVISPNFNIVMRNWFPHFECRVKTHTNITSNQYWAGFMSAEVAGTADPNTLHVAAFRYSTDVDGTAFWRTYTAGAGGASTATATSTAIATDTQYLLRVEMDSGEVRFYIDNVLVDTSTTNLPGASNMVGYGTRVHHLGAAGTKRIYWSYIGVHSDH